MEPSRGADVMKVFLWAAAAQRVSSYDSQWLQLFLHDTAIVILLIFHCTTSEVPLLLLKLWTVETSAPKPRKLSGELSWLIKYYQICRHHWLFLIASVMIMSPSEWLIAHNWLLLKLACVFKLCEVVLQHRHTIPHSPFQVKKKKKP